MDFLDLTSYSPTSESITYPDQYDNNYQLDSYVPDYSFNSCEADLFSDTVCFPTTPNFWSTESPNQSDSAPSASASPTTISTNPTAWPDLGQHAPFGNLGDLSPAFTAPQAIKMSSSPCLSPKSLTHPSPSSSTSDHHSEGDARPPPRKRGRPRLYRQSTGSSDSASEKAAYPQRLPHNQVERKYREGLNMELERLRRAVPTLPQGDAGAAMGSAKPSKAMVLQAAIEYIKKIEKERDEAVFQVERLRGGNMTAAMLAAL